MDADRNRRASVGVGLALLLTAIAAAAIMGCGGSGDGSVASTVAAHPKPRPLARSELIARADAVCVAGQRDYEAISKKAYPDPRHTSVPNPTERLPNVEYSENVVELAKRLVRRLSSLAPPPQLRKGYEAYVAAVKEVEQLAEQALQASVEDNGGAYYKARKTRDAGALERANLAEAVGLKKCSPNPFFH
jgi:hypothetical protein